MKFKNRFWLGAVALSVLASCAEDSLLDYSVEQPESIAQLEYLKDYDVLKSYVDRSANPNFKLGVGVSVGNYNKKGVDYSLITSNFDEMTAGWEMKHGAIVQDDGSLNTSRVESFMATAESAGLTIYGHTLCWHANQNADYLNRIIAPTIIPATGGPALDPSVITDSDFENGVGGWMGWGNGSTRDLSADGEGYGDSGFAYTFTNPSVTNFWSAQVAYDIALDLGETYQLNFKVRATSGGTIRAEVQSTSDYSSDSFGTFGITEDWQEYTFEVTTTAADRNRFVISFGDYAGTVYIDDITLSRVNPDAGGPVWEVMTANDFETDDNSNYLGNTNALMSFTADGDGANGDGRALVITNEAVRANSWDSQFFFILPKATELEQKLILEMDVKADAAAAVSTQAHTVPYSYKHWSFFGDVNFTTEWVHFSREITVDANTSECTAIAFNLGNTATNYYLDNISVSWFNEEGGGEQIIEMTPEEKRDTISYAMESWIAGILELTNGTVKAWDVVNEPMDDGSPYELKTGVGRTDMPADHFYWQDYLGKDYAVMAFNLAAEYGSSDDLLFINDYNLEYNLDKCKGLIAYVEYIESAGARVDGIGTQMHINTESDKDKIVEMFELLAATGKWIKISELDIGVGKQTPEATMEDYEAQAEMYRFVLAKYFELIPAAQRYGVTAWSPYDSPAGSSWRAGQPIGLWTESYSRKPAYAGFAEGLSGN